MAVSVLAPDSVNVFDVVREMIGVAVPTIVGLDVDETELTIESVREPLPVEETDKVRGGVPDFEPDAVGVSVAVFVTVSVTEVDTVELLEDVEVVVIEFVAEAVVVTEKVRVGDELDVVDMLIVAVMVTVPDEDVVDVIELDTDAEAVEVSVAR